MSEKTNSGELTTVHTAADTPDGGCAHVVGIGKLRVLVTNDDDSWFAQGLEIDYAAQGATLEEVKAAFIKGLVSTVHEHLRMNGDIKKLVNPAPTAVWQELQELAVCKRLMYYQASIHQFPNALGFNGIDFFETRAAA